jgi:undecaprenyl-diphosphatase
MVETSLQSTKPSAPGLWTLWPIRSRAAAQILAAFLVLVVAGLSAGWLLLGPMAGSWLAEWDRSLAVWLANRRSPTLDTLTNLGSAFSDTVSIIVGLLVLMVAMTLVWRRWRESLTLGVALGLEASVFLVVSSVIGRDRPPVEQLDPSPPTASFPSGHTGAAFAFYLGIGLVVYWTTHRRLPRAIATLIAASIPIIVAISRMYRGMHFLTDVLFGAALGAACIVGAAVIVPRAASRRRAEL